MKPTAYFTYDVKGLSVTFIDRSSNIPTNWSWNFGDTNSPDNTSSDQNPTHEFSGEGLFKVSLIASNSDGSSTLTYHLVITQAPNVNVDIYELVKYQIPGGLTVDENQFMIAVKKWQLYIGPLLSPEIKDEDIFNQTKYPPLVNVLISKLIVYDIILQASAYSMTSYYNAISKLNDLTTSTTTVAVADYSVDLPLSIFDNGDITIEQLQVNGTSFGPSSSLSNISDTITWLNGLGQGIFSYEDEKLWSKGNANILTDFNYTDGLGSGHNLQFLISNERVIPISYSQTSSGGTVPGLKGSVKSIQTGPSTIEWNDASSYWSAMFKSSGNASGLAGAGGGIFQNLITDICSYASRVRVKLPMCPGYISKTLNFRVAKGRVCEPIGRWDIGWPCCYDKPIEQG